MTTIFNLVFLLIGFALGAGSKVAYDYYQQELKQQQKIKDDMAEVLYRFKRMEEERSNKK